MNGPEVQPILDSAEQAVSSGDYARAESLLREVARLQAESLGSKHPDLASTFNNLGVVCERANKLVDAGRFYREALSIASASLNAEDPLVVTSRNNCNEFHRGLGLVDTYPTSAELPRELPRQAIVAGIAMGVALLGALAIWFTHTPGDEPTTQKTAIVEERLPQFGDPLVPATPPPATKAAPAPATKAAPAPATKATPPPATKAAPATPIKAAPAKMTISAPQKVDVQVLSQKADAQVLEASLCQSLSTSGGRWECTPTSDPAAGDWLYFYSRIAASTSTSIHHRWYRNGTLRRDVGLAVQANPSAGYRTYSQLRVETGDWRIVVAGPDGEILREASVEVR